MAIAVGLCCIACVLILLWCFRRRTTLGRTRLVYRTLTGLKDIPIREEAIRAATFVEFSIKVKKDKPP